MRRWENFKTARLWRVNFGRWNLARHLDYKILSHSNGIKFQARTNPAYTTPVRADARLRRRKALAPKPIRAASARTGPARAKTRPRQNPNLRVLHMKF